MFGWLLTRRRCVLYSRRDINKVMIMEKVKACYFQLDIPSLRNALDQCDIPKE